MPITFRRGPDNPPPVAPQSFSPAAAGGPGASIGDPTSQPQRQLAATVLVELFHYLSANVRQHPTLVPVMATLSSAIADYRAGQSPDPLSGPRSVYAAIQTARLADTTAPDP